MSDKTSQIYAIHEAGEASTDSTNNVEDFYIPGGYDITSRKSDEQGEAGDRTQVGDNPGGRRWIFKKAINATGVRI